MEPIDAHPLKEYLDTLPEPVTIREKLICWWSNLIDDISVLKWKIVEVIKGADD